MQSSCTMLKTPREALDGAYVDKKCPFTGTVLITGRILESTLLRTMIVVRIIHSFHILTLLFSLKILQITMKAPKVLADLLESLAGAVYIDVNFDIQRLWVIFRGLLEPIITLDDLQRQPQPVSMLFKLCHKHKKRIDIKIWKETRDPISETWKKIWLVDSKGSLAHAKNLFSTSRAMGA